MSVSFLNEPALTASITASTNYSPVILCGLTAEEFSARIIEMMKFYNGFWDLEPIYKPIRRIQRIKRRKINGKRSCTYPMYKRGRPTFELVRSQLHR